MTTLPNFKQIAATNGEGGLMLFAIGDDGQVWQWQNDDGGHGWNVLPHVPYPTPDEDEASDGHD